MGILTKLIQEGWWGGEPEKSEEREIGLLSDEQFEFFRKHKYVILKDDQGGLWKMHRGYWSYEQWAANPKARTFFDFQKDTTVPVCNCCGRVL